MRADGSHIIIVPLGNQTLRGRKVPRCIRCMVSLMGANWLRAVARES